MARELETELNKNDTASKLNVQSVLLDCLSRIVRESTNSRSDKPAPMWLRKANLYIESNFHRGISLKTIASHVGVHPVHLSREMRRFHKRSVGQMIRNLRLDKAREYLADSNFNITQIGSSIGLRGFVSFLPFL